MNPKLKKVIKLYASRFNITHHEAEGLIAKAIKYYLCDDDVLRMAFVK